MTEVVAASGLPTTHLRREIITPAISLPYVSSQPDGVAAGLLMLSV